MRALCCAFPFIAVAALAQIPNPVKSGDSFDVSGTVVDAKSGNPVPRAQVSLQSEEAATSVSSQSDGSGNFVFPHIAIGTYSINATKRGYASGTASFHKVILVGGTQPDHFTLKLEPQAVLSGTVIDDHNEPVAEAQLVLLRPEIVSGRRVLRAVTTANTDDQGAFRFYGLGAGQYYVEAVVQASTADLQKHRGYPPTLYPNATTVAGAQTIELRPDLEQRVNIQVSLGDAYRIRGRLNPPATEADLRLHGLDGNEAIEIPASTHFNAKDSSFEITGVPPGTYLLSAMIDTRGNRRVAYRDVSVNADVSDVTLDYTVNQPIPGVVKLEGDGSPDSAMSQVTATNGAQGYASPVQKNGTFAVGPLPPGKWRISGTFGPNWYLKAATLAGVDVLTDGIVSQGQGVSGNLQLVVSPKGGTLEATVTWPDQGPRPPVLVTVLRARPNEMQRVAAVEVAAPNSPAVTRPALIGGLPPGDYVVYAWPQPVDVEYANPEALRDYEGFAQEVHIDEAAQARAALNVALNP